MMLHVVCMSVCVTAAPPELLRPPTALLALEEAACGQGNAAGSSSGPGGWATRVQALAKWTALGSDIGQVGL